MALRIVSPSETTPSWDDAFAASPAQLIVDDARALFEQHARAVSRIGASLGPSFARAVDLILGCSGRVVVCGMGKSGLIGRKMAATFASTGTPSFFLHAGEASHGDLGMVMPNDLVVLISNSGETEEVLRLVPYFQEVGIPIVAMVGKLPAPLASAADVVLDVSIEREACPLNLAPMTSALTTLAMGDALAASLIRARNFQPRDFARFHPGGSLGRRLITRVCDVMQKENLPFVAPTESVGECLIRMTEGRCGLAIVVDAAGKLAGLVTDGDLRRGLQRRPELLDLTVQEVMTKNPVTIEEDAALGEAEERMTRLRLKALVVLNSEGLVRGVVEIFLEPQMKASPILLALALTGVGSACSSHEPEARSPEDVVATEHPGRLEPTSPGEKQLLERLDTLGPEETLAVDDSSVTAEASYWSASGNECRRASFVSGNERRERLACRDEAGWFFVPDVFGGAP